MLSIAIFGMQFGVLTFSGGGGKIVTDGKEVIKNGFWLSGWLWGYRLSVLGYRRKPNTED